jgi:hypothetical protein
MIEAKVEVCEREEARMNERMAELERKGMLVEAEIEFIEQRKMREVEAEIQLIENSISVVEDKLKARERILRLEKEGRITHDESNRLLQACEKALGNKGESHESA